MTGLFVAAAFLLGSHYGISATPLRGWLIGRLGERAYLVLYAVVALGTLALLIVAYRRAPYVEWWPMTVWAAWVPLIVMPFALLLAVCGAGALKPAAVGAPASLDQAQPVRGMLRVTRHPFMWGVALWALAHLPPNGAAAEVVLFTTFAILALLGTRMIDRKFAARRPATWQRLVASSSNLPFGAILAGWQQAGSISCLRRLAGGGSAAQCCSTGSCLRFTPGCSAFLRSARSDRATAQSAPAATLPARA